MRRTRRYTISTAISLLIVGANSLAALAATLPPLGTAGKYAVIASSTVTNTGRSWITGQIALFPGTSVTGFPPGTSGHKDVGPLNNAAKQAEAGLSTAYLNAAGQTPCTTVGVNLGGLTLGPGLYCAGTMGITGGQTLTLNGGGVYIFQIASTLITGSASRVLLIGGALPCDVFWQVGSSATIATSTTFVGNIMAQTSIAMQTGATLNGRAMARTGAVTLDTNRIIQPAGCGYTAPTFVAPPARNTLPATLAPSSPIRGVPSAGGGPPQDEGFPWILALVAGVLGSAGAVRVGLSIRAHRHST